MHRLFIPGLLALGLFSCRESNNVQQDPAKPATSVAAAPTPSSSAASAAVKSSPVTDAVREAARCSWVDDDKRPTSSQIDPACAAFKSWGDNLDALGADAESDLIELLGDSNRAVRWIAAKGLIQLNVMKTPYRKNAVASRVILKRAAEEKEPSVAYALGFLVGRISFSATKLHKEGLELLKTGSDYVREGIIRDILAWNGEEEGVRAAIEAIARGPASSTLREVAVQTIAQRSLDEQTCKLFVELLKDADTVVAAQAAYQAAGAYATKGCPQEFDTVLSEIERRINEKLPLHQGMSGAAGRIAAQEKVKPAQKTKAISLLKKIVETKTLEESVRWRALDVLGTVDPGAKTFAAKFKNDEASTVQRAAESILAKK